MPRPSYLPLCIVTCLVDLVCTGTDVARIAFPSHLLTASLIHCDRYKRGYKNVIGKGVSLGKEGVDCQLMMETSGHGAVKENFYLDDGAYLAVMVSQGRPVA